MEQQNFGTPVPPAQRPTFLTVLCILSWIWQGILAIIILLGALAIGAITAGYSSDAVQNELAEMSASDPDAAAAVSTVATTSAGLLWAAVIIGFICVVLSFIGVLQMWKLKKSGFYIYTAAFVISAIMGFVGGEPSYFGLVIGAAFVAMYAANLKYMR
jgi:hypothetical protein